MEGTFDRKGHQTFVVNAVTMPNTGNPTKDLNVEQQDLDSSVNRDLVKVIATSSSIDNLGGVSEYGTKKTNEKSHRENEAKQ